MKAENDAGSPSPDKVPRRRYKRHPKADPNAPERPLTAYVRFSKDLIKGLTMTDKRKEYQERRLSFSELAKQIGIDWQELLPAVKDEYLSGAASDWTTFRKALDEYHMTQQYAEYVKYLRNFANENPDSNVKLPHLDPGTSPVQGSSKDWEVEIGPFGQMPQSPSYSSEPMSAIQQSDELDIDRLYQSYSHLHDQEQQQQQSLMQNEHQQRQLDHQSQLYLQQQQPPPTDLFRNINDTFSRGIQQSSIQVPSSQLASTKPSFVTWSDPWQPQPSLRLRSIGPGSRYDRTNVPLHQALYQASDARAHGQRSHSSSTPGSEFSSTTTGTPATAAAIASNRVNTLATINHGAHLQPFTNFNVGPRFSNELEDGNVYQMQHPQEEEFDRLYREMMHSSNSTSGHFTAGMEDPPEHSLEDTFRGITAPDQR